MEEKPLVDEILKRVLEKMKVSESCLESVHPKPKLLILTENHGTSCHEALESDILLKHCNTECALTKNYECNLDDYEAIILFNLNNNALSKLSRGICDSPFLNLACEAILNGKKIYVPNEEIELYQYKDSAPKAFYNMMVEKLEFLKACGMILCNRDQLENDILHNIVTDETSKKMTKNQEVKEALPNLVNKSVVLDKKVVTEKDIERAYTEGATTIYITTKTILSDLAKESAKYRNIQFQRTQTNLGKMGISI